MLHGPRRLPDRDDGFPSIGLGIPMLSVVLIFHNMRREAMRTLRTLASDFQRNIRSDEYEVIAIDNGSSEPLDPQVGAGLGSAFRYHFNVTKAVSPAAAVNLGVRLARGSHVCVCIDGARMLSPGILSGMLAAFRAWPNAFVSTLGWHLGEEVQNLSVAKGYCQSVEDKLLASVDWQADGYALFDISAIALSCRNGWFSPIAESNCFALARADFLRMGGMDEAFSLPGGGLVNLDFFHRAIEDDALVPVTLLGEGTFHQFHGGVASNAPMDAHPWEKFEEEYRDVRGRPFRAPEYSPVYLGRVGRAASRFLTHGQRAGD